MCDVARGLLTVMLGAGLASAQTPADRIAQPKITRLAPAAFRAVPQRVRRDLVKRGCLVPQTSVDAAPHNAVHGAFLARGADDWAVLCSVRGSSSIVVYHDGKRVASLATAADKTYIQSGARGAGSGAGFSRRILRIRPPRADHDGIEDSFLEKGSTTWYFARARWRRIQGAD